MNHLKHILILFFTTFYITIFCQNPFYKNLNKGNGLASNTVYDLIQNKEGFLFFATDKGLVRYDGVNFINYKSPTKNSKALSNLIEIENGDVFCQNFIGEIFHTKQDKLISDDYLNTTGNYYAMRKWENCIVAFNTDTLKLYDYANKNIKKYNAKNAYIINALANKNSIYCMDSDYNLLCFKGSNWELIYKNEDKKLNQVFHLEFLKKGILLLKKTDNALVRILKDGKIIETKGIKENVFINSVKNIKGKLWICTTNGLYVFDENFNSLNNNKSYFESFNISSIIEDCEGSYWISTIDKGVIYVPNFEVKEYGKTSYQLSAVSKIKNQLLLGTYDNKVLKFNTNSKQFNEVFHAGYSNEINSVVYDSINDCIIAGSSHLFFIKNKQLLYSQTTGIKDIKLTNNQVLLTAFSTGSSFFKPPITKLFYQNPTYASQVWNQNSIPILPSYNYRTRAVEYFKTDSLIFTANSKGLFKIEKSVCKEIKFNDSSIIASSLFVSGKKLYIGTFSNSIYQYDISLRQLNKILLIKPIIKSCLKIKIYNEKIYVINEDGLFCIDEVSKDIKHWNITDGLNTDAELKDFIISNDTLYIATNQGLVIFSTNLASKNSVRPNIIINVPQNYHLQKKSVWYINNSNKDLSIQFSVIAFKGQDSIKVFSKINDDAWLLLTDKERKIQLSYLAPGKYYIQIKAVNEDGTEFIYPEPICIVVKPPFYQSWWFISILMILSIILGLWINKYRLRKIMQKQKEESDQQYLKQQIDLSALKTLRAQMNPHFIFNALNSIQSYVYSGEKEKAGKFLSLFSDLCRSLLNNSSEQEVNLYDEIKLIDLYLKLECTRLPKISYKIVKDETIKLHDTYIPAMIVQPIVENAVKHGLSNKSGEGFVEIRFSIFRSNLIIEIEDDGVGISNSKEFNNRILNKSESFATKAIEDRITLLNKNKTNKIEHLIIDKIDNKGVSKGTLVKLIIPIDYD